MPMTPGNQRESAHRNDDRREAGTKPYQRE
jgi:hypothetical protein